MSDEEKVSRSEVLCIVRVTCEDNQEVTAYQPPWGLIIPAPIPRLTWSSSAMEISPGPLALGLEEIQLWECTYFNKNWIYVPQYYPRTQVYHLCWHLMHYCQGGESCEFGKEYGIFWGKIFVKTRLRTSATRVEKMQVKSTVWLQFLGIFIHTLAGDLLNHGGFSM